MEFLSLVDMEIDEEDLQELEEEMEPEAFYPAQPQREPYNEVPYKKQPAAHHMQKVNMAAQRVC